MITLSDNFIFITILLNQLLIKMNYINIYQKETITLRI